MLAVPATVGALAGRFVAQRVLQAQADGVPVRSADASLTILATAAQTGIAIALLAWAAGGPLGIFGIVGSNWWLTGVLVFAWVGLLGLITAQLLMWREGKFAAAQALDDDAFDDDAFADDTDEYDTDDEYDDDLDFDDDDTDDEVKAIEAPDSETADADTDDADTDDADTDDADTDDADDEDIDDDPNVIEAEVVALEDDESVAQDSDTDESDTAVDADTGRGASGIVDGEVEDKREKGDD
jgi:hypothetical protein